MTLSTFWACVITVSDDLASVPWRVFLRENGGRRIDEDDIVDWILHFQPNPFMTPFTFRQTMISRALIHGNAFAEIERNTRGDPVWVWPLKPGRVKPVYDKDTKAYYWEVLNYETREPTYLPWSDLLQFRGLGDEFMGYSVLEAMTRVGNIALNTDKFASNTSKSTVRPGGVIEYDQVLDPESAARLTRDFTNRHLKRPGSVGVLERGMKFKPYDVISPHDAQLIESRKFNAEDICRFFKIPPHKVSLLDRATFNNIEHLSITYVMTCLLPWAVRLEQDANVKLFGRNTMRRKYTKHNLAALMRGDSKARAEFYDVMIRNAGMSPNEMRAFEDLNPVEFGDTLFVPAQWNTLERAARGEPVSSGEDTTDSNAEARGIPPEDSQDHLAKLAHEAVTAILRREAHMTAEAVRRLGKATDALSSWAKSISQDNARFASSKLATVLASTVLSESSRKEVTDVFCTLERLKFRELFKASMPDNPNTIYKIWESERLPELKSALIQSILFKLRTEVPSCP